LDKYPNFRIFGDSDVLPLMRSEEQRQIYREISLPAGKSDVARLLLLREYGGLYIDAHAGPASGERLAETLDALSSYDLVLFCRLYLAKTQKETHLMNGAFVARRNAPILTTLLDCAFDHLSQHRQAERATQEHVNYTLWGMAGTWILLKCLFDVGSEPYKLKPEFNDKVSVHNMTGPDSPGFHVYQFYQYREPGQHWSERQKNERLFREPI
jgi:hypothetical protein